MLTIPITIPFTTYHQICNKCSTTGVTRGEGTAYISGALKFTHVCGGDRVAQSLVFCIAFCISLFVVLSFFFWTLYYLSFALRLLITPLISSNVFFNVTEFTPGFLRGPCCLISSFLCKSL